MPSKKEQRLDSLALLIEGKSPCGATHFDGKTLFLANNEQDWNSINFIIGQLKAAASSHYAVSQQMVPLQNELNQYEKLRDDLFARIDKLNSQGKKTGELKKKIPKIEEKINVVLSEYKTLYRAARKTDDYISKNIINYAGTNSLLRSEKHKNDFIKATSKVVQSIRYAYLKESDKYAWSRELVEALRQGHFVFARYRG